MHIHGLLVCYVWALLSYSMSMSNRTLRIINGSHYTQLCLLHYQLIRSVIIDTVYSIPNSFCCSSMIRQENTTPNQINIKKRTVSFFWLLLLPTSHSQSRIWLIQSRDRFFTQNINNKNQEIWQLDNGFLCCLLYWKEEGRRRRYIDTLSTGSMVLGIIQHVK